MFMGEFPELNTSEVVIFCGNSYLGIYFSTYVKMCANFSGPFISTYGIVLPYICIYIIFIRLSKSTLQSVYIFM